MPIYKELVEKKVHTKVTRIEGRELLEGWEKSWCSRFCRGEQGQLWVVLLSKPSECPLLKVPILSSKVYFSRKFYKRHALQVPVLTSTPSVCAHMQIQLVTWHLVNDFLKRKFLLSANIVIHKQGLLEEVGIERVRIEQSLLLMF